MAQAARTEQQQTVDALREARSRVAALERYSSQFENSPSDPLCLCVCLCVFL